MSVYCNRILVISLLYGLYLISLELFQLLRSKKKKRKERNLLETVFFYIKKLFKFLKM